MSDFRNTLKLSNNGEDSLLVQNIFNKDVNITANKEKNINFNAKSFSFKNNQGLVISDIVSEFFDVKNSIELQKEKIDTFLEDLTNDNNVNTLKELLTKINNDNNTLLSRITSIENVINEITDSNGLPSN